MQLPETYIAILESEGRPLAEINPGSSEIALPRSAAIKALEALGGTNIAILGGDVLVANGQLRYVDANWHSDRHEGELAATFARRSHVEASDYIRNYPQGIGPQPLFVLVIEEVR